MTPDALAATEAAAAALRMARQCCTLVRPCLCALQTNYPENLLTPTLRVGLPTWAGSHAALAASQEQLHPAAQTQSGGAWRAICSHTQVGTPAPADLLQETHALTGAGSPTCDVFISHMGADTGISLAGFLQRELTANGLNAFLDHSNGPQAGDLWPEVLWQAAWSCSVFIVLISPGFFLREWPVRELCIALERLRASPAAVTVVPVYCGWTRQQAAVALRAAASSADGRLQFQNADTGKGTQGTIWQPAAHQPRQQAAAQALVQTQTLNSLLQQLSDVQQPNAPRIFHEHYKLIEVETVAELVRAALRVVHRPDFEVPKGKLLTLWQTAHLRSPLLQPQHTAFMLQALWARMTLW